MEHDNLLEGRINDLSQRAYNNDYLTHTNFLSASDMAMFYAMLRARGISSNVQSLNGTPYVVYGGHEDADRNVICFLPSYLSSDDFMASETATGDILKCLHITPLNSKFADDLTHRDFLGALMNMGIEREKVGDILLDGNDAYVFVMADIAEIIARELCRIKHTSVSCAVVAPAACTVTPRFTHMSGSVASQRLDAIIAMVYHLARGKSQDYIKAERVFVDGRTVTDAGYNLKPGERVSVRGQGKFIFTGMGPQTKKGRFYAEVDVYA